MNLRAYTCFIVIILTVVCTSTAVAQLKARAISYSLDIYLDIYDPEYYEETESEDVVCHFELDAYYTGDKVKTVVRKLSVPIDYDIDFMSVLYDRHTNNQYHINHTSKSVYPTKGQPLTPTATRNRKEILGHKCREYYFLDPEGISASFWVAEKLEKNICPTGNFLIKGTVLEMLTSDGMHFKATDIGMGELAADFFELPPGYTEKNSQD